VIALVLGTLTTAFQMIFGGGASYLTSKMKNLSNHKLMIEEGFDLQFRIFQKQELESKKIIQVSDTFKELFKFLNYNDKKEVKVILGTTGIGFSSNIKQWIWEVQKKDKQLRYYYYDMSEPAIHTNNAAEHKHIDCISAIVYSLLHAEDRNIVLSLFKEATELVFSFFVKVLRWAQANIAYILLYLSFILFAPQIFYLITL
jgi:hypothetical protein